MTRRLSYRVISWRVGDIKRGTLYRPVQISIKTNDVTPTPVPYSITMTVDHPCPVSMTICRILCFLSRGVNRLGFVVITVSTLWDQITLHFSQCRFRQSCFSPDKSCLVLPEFLNTYTLTPVPVKTPKFNSLVYSSLPLFVTTFLFFCSSDSFTIFIVKTYMI